MNNRIGIVIKKRIRLIRKGIVYFRLHGLKRTIRRIYEVLGYRTDYREWMREHAYSQHELKEQRTYQFDQKITFSIITPVYNTPKKYLRDMIESVLDQTYSSWELCLADGSDDEHNYVETLCQDYSKKDTRIKYKKLDKNLGIIGNSNEALKLATGEYISLLDHDDILHPAALFKTIQAVCDKNADIIYTDEMIFKGSNTKDVQFIHFKPDFALDNLLANNYICHFTSFRKSLIDECGPFREGFEGSQDHDLMLRLTSKAHRIVHIPEVLYYWRSHKNSTAASPDNKNFCTVSGIKAVSDYLDTHGIKGSVELAAGLPTTYRVRYELIQPIPKVSIIIPNYEHLNDLSKCINSIIEKTTYPNYEIVIVENNSKSSKIFDYYTELKSNHTNIKVIVRDGEFNWSALNNFGIENSSGDYALLLNNDTEVISPDWINEMMMFAQRSDVGIVGAMLYYPDDTIQHAGVIVGLGGVAAHAFIGSVRGEYGYMGRLVYAQDMTAVTGACMLVKKAVWEQVDGFDEELSNNYNDIDFCLRVRKADYSVVWTPYAELYHAESRSRGFNETTEKRVKFKKETDHFLAKWQQDLEAGDPYYNRNLTIRRANFATRKKNESDKPEYDLEAWL